MIYDKSSETISFVGQMQEGQYSITVILTDESELFSETEFIFTVPVVKKDEIP